MKKVITLLFLFSLATMQTVIAQPSCDSGRYLTSTFAAQVTSEPAIYATAPAIIAANDAWTTDEDLSFDFYEPAGDTLSKRPLIIMAFGGAFLLGSKTQGELVDFANAMASRGFCVANIDYRLGFNTLSTGSATRAVYRAAQDFKAAVRYFRANADMYRIDPDHVFGGGNSAGSISAIHAAYIDEVDRTPTSLLGPTFQDGSWDDLGCLDCSGNNIVMNSEPNVVLNFWGAIGDLNFIEAGEAPIISFHGTDDGIVFPDCGRPFSYPIFPVLCGSIPIDEQATSVGITSELHVFPGEGHELWGDPLIAAFMQEESADFLYQYMKPALPVVSGDPVVCSGNPATYCTEQAPGSGYCWTVTGGTVIADNGNCITIDWGAAGTSGTIEVRERTCLDVVSDPVSVNVVVSAAPVAAFSYLYNDSAVDFANESVNATTQVWDFGDGNISTELNPSHIYAENGTYDVTLTVTSADGCEQTFMNTVEQNCQPNLTLNVSATPSGVYTVADWIYSEEPTEAASNVVFVAGDYIELGAGFEVPVGVEFIATILSCGDNPPALTEDESSEESEEK